MQEFSEMANPHVIQSPRSSSLENGSKNDKEDGIMVRSHQNQRKRMEQQLQESFQRLTDLEEQNAKLKDEFLMMKQAAEKLVAQKETIKQKLDQKIQNINQMQSYFNEQNELKNFEWSQKIQQSKLELEQKNREIQILKSEYLEQIKQKDETIDYLQEQLENQKEKLLQYEKNDYILNQKLVDLESQNQQLEKDLIQSQTSLFDLHKSITEQKMKIIETNQDIFLCQIIERVVTEQTETDTTYAIQSLENKIRLLKQNHQRQKEEYKASMEGLIEYYEIQINEAKQQLFEGNKPVTFHKLKSTIMSISQNMDNYNFVPLKQQILETVKKNPTSVNSNIKQREQYNKHESIQKLFDHQHFFVHKGSFQQIAQQQLDCQQSTKKINLIQQSKQKAKESKFNFKLGKVLSVIAGAALILFTTRRFFPKS